MSRDGLGIDIFGDPVVLDDVGNYDELLLTDNQSSPLPPDSEECFEMLFSAFKCDQFIYNDYTYPGSVTNDLENPYYYQLVSPLAVSPIRRPCDEEELVTCPVIFRVNGQEQIQRPPDTSMTSLTSTSLKSPKKSSDCQAKPRMRRSPKPSSSPVNNVHLNNRVNNRKVHLYELDESSFTRQEKTRVIRAKKTKQFHDSKNKKIQVAEQVMQWIKGNQQVMDNLKSNQGLFAAASEHFPSVFND